MTVYRKDPLLGGDKPLQYPKTAEAYELRLIDDDDGGKESYKPYYEVGALDTRERVGEYASLAFVQVRNYKPKGPENDGVDQKMMDELKKENKRMLNVQVNTTLLKTKFQLIFNENDTAR